MEPHQEQKICKKLAKGIVCTIVIILTIPGITILTLASVVIWFYGQEIMESQFLEHFKFLEDFLPAIMMPKKEKDG